MKGINYLAVLVAAVATFVLSFLWYALFGGRRAALIARASGAGPALEAGGSRRMPAWKVILELARNLVLGFVVAHILVLCGAAHILGAIRVGAWLWIGFPAVLLSGSVLHERVPFGLAAIHAGDWLVKLLAMSAILGAWH